jgi:hypothetical protein
MLSAVRITGQGQTNRAVVAHSRIKGHPAIISRERARTGTHGVSECDRPCADFHGLSGLDPGGGSLALRDAYLAGSGGTRLAGAAGGKRLPADNAIGDFFKHSAQATGPVTGMFSDFFRPSAAVGSSSTTAAGTFAIQPPLPTRSPGCCCVYATGVPAPSIRSLARMP